MARDQVVSPVAELSLVEELSHRSRSAVIEYVLYEGHGGFLHLEVEDHDVHEFVLPSADASLVVTRTAWVDRVN